MKKWTLNQFQIGKDTGVGLQIPPNVNLNLKTKRIKLRLKEVDFSIWGLKKKSIAKIDSIDQINQFYSLMMKSANLLAVQLKR
jgi:hypothetical protein